MTANPRSGSGASAGPTAVVAVVVRWRGGTITERCLESLLGDSGRRTEEIVVVDSGSGDGGAGRIAHTFTDVRVEALPENVGFAAAANHGVAVTTAPLILLLNPDTELLGDGLALLVDRLAANPTLAGVVPLLEGTDGATQHRWQLKRLPTVFDLALGRSGRPAFAAPPTSVRPVAQPAAAAWLIRRTVWRALHGLDEGFRPAWWEDVDLCRRLESKLGSDGFPCDRGFVVEPGARVLHHGGHSVNDLGRDAFLRAYYGNLLRYAQRYHAGSIGLIRIGLRISNALRKRFRWRVPGA